MVWWQGVLLFLGLCIAGVLLGILISYVVFRIRRQPWPYSWRFSRKRAGIVGAEEIEPNLAAQHSPVEVVTKQQSTLAEEQVKTKKSDILVEVETNLAIASQPLTGKLEPFQTAAWDNQGKNSVPLSTGIQEELLEAYTDMRLANTLVWLSTDAGRRTKDLDDSYLKLCARIKERLERVKTSL